MFYIKTFISFLFDPEIFKRNRYWLVLVSSLVASIFIYFFVEYYCKKKRINILSFNKFFNYFFLASLLVVLFSIFNLVKINLDAGKELKTFEAEFKKNYYQTAHYKILYPKTGPYPRSNLSNRFRLPDVDEFK